MKGKWTPRIVMIKRGRLTRTGLMVDKLMADGCEICQETKQKPVQTSLFD